MNKKLKHLVICGTGAFARELYWHATQSVGYGTEWDIKGFLDGSKKLSAEEYKKLPLPVLGEFDRYEIKEDDVFTCAVGFPTVRKEFIEVLEKRGASFINLIHQTSIVHKSARLGKGIVLCPFTYVFDNASIDDYVLFNVGTGAGHDTKVGKYSSLMGHVELCGHVEVGKECFFGSGARVLPSGKVGDNAFVGAGSVVIKKVKSGDKVFGNPAKVLDV